MGLITDRSGWHWLPFMTTISTLGCIALIKDQVRFIESLIISLQKLLS